MEQYKQEFIEFMIGSREKLVFLKKFLQKQSINKLKSLSILS